MPSTPVLQAPGISDIVATTLRDLGRLRFTDISSTLQRHVAMSNLLNKNNVVLESGYGIQFNLMVEQSGAAANMGLGASDDVNIPDLMTNGTADWRNSGTNYGLIGQTVAMNREPSRIVNYVQTQRLGALISLAELMESNFWGPPVAANDNVTPWGANTWIVKNATQGFNGGAPSGYTTIGGVNPTTYPNWNNWTDQYVAVSKDDLIRRWRKAGYYTDFRPTVSGIPTYNTGDQPGYYLNYAVLSPLQENLEAQNDNLGNDIAPKDSVSVMFRGVPVTWVPKLDADTTNPVYGIQWGVFKTYVLKGWWLKETAVPIYPGQHNLSAQFIDLTYQWVCLNRRNNFVIATGTSYPS